MTLPGHDEIFPGPRVGDPSPTPRVSWPWVAVFAVVAVAAILLHSPLLSVARIEVVGSVRSDAAERIAASGVGEGALLLWVDTGSVRRAVAADPWVHAVSVDRVWPNRVVVDVVERRPIAWVEGATSWMLVATDGVVLELEPAPTPDFLQAAVAMPDRLPGQAPTEAVWREVVAMAVVLHEGVGPGLRVEMRGSQLWTELDGVEVRFGHPIDLADKARALTAILGGALPAGARVDLTSPQRPAVRLPDDPQQEVEG